MYMPSLQKRRAGSGDGVYAVHVTPPEKIEDFSLQFYPHHAPGPEIRSTVQYYSTVRALPDKYLVYTFQCQLYGNESE